MSLAFPLSSTNPSKPHPSDPNQAVEMTVLIAMPNPTSAPSTAPEPEPEPEPEPAPEPASTTASAPMSLSQSVPASRRSSTCFSTLFHPDPDTDELPLVEIATTVIPLAPLGDGQNQTMDKLRREARVRNGTQRPSPSDGEVRVERTDGFRSI